ncbi:hypothetical protein K438DRAFT_2152929, partial [Mycena galopus ATCC 62051]
LERVQNHTLRLICAAFWTTPITGLQIKASVPPIRYTLDQLGHNTVIRFNKLPISSPIIQQLPDKWRGEERGSENAQGQSPVGTGIMIYHEGRKLFAGSVGLGKAA